MLLDSKNRLIFANHLAKKWFRLGKKQRFLALSRFLRSPDLAPLWHLKANEHHSLDFNSVLGHFRLHMYRLENLSLLIAEDNQKSYRIDQMRQDFVANVSHELRTPLTVILGYLEWFTQEPGLVDSPWQQPLEAMYNQAQRMNHIIQDLLTLSQLESESYQLELEILPIVDFVQSLYSDFKPVAEQKQQHFKLILPDENIHLKADPRLLTTAVANLLTNAMKYTQEKGRIKLVVGLENQEVSFCVTDNGPGIAPEHLQRLTERFYRVDKNRSRAAGGTGLGLSIVKHTAERHGGYLEIDSKPGQGSRFCLRIPLVV